MFENVDPVLNYTSYEKLKMKYSSPVYTVLFILKDHVTQNSATNSLLSL